MSYAICRLEKVGSSHDIAGIQIHDRRERTHSNSNPDIDFSRSHLNYSLCDNSNGSSFNAFIDNQIAERYTGKKTIRKDAVRMVSVLFTSDKDFFDSLSSEQQRDYFQSCYEWASERWGADNIISSIVHMDEECPHMHLNFVPLTTEGRLSAKDCVGSGSKALQQLQDNFFKTVGKPYGLERGNRADLDNGEKPRRHQSTSEYKASTNYYQQQKNALQATVQALQGQVDRFNEIIHAEPKNAIEGVPVPSMAKIAVGKENKDKLLYSPTDIEQVQELAKAVAVVAAANEQRSSELSLKAAELSEREHSVEEKEKAAQKMMNNIEETEREVQFKLQQAERNYQEMQKEPYVATLQKRIKEIDTASDKLAADWHEEHQKYEKARKALNAAEREIAPLKQQNGELSEQIRTLEEQVQQLSKELIETEKAVTYNNKLYNAACDIGERLKTDFNTLVDKRLNGYSVSHIFGDDRNRGR